MCPAAPWLLMCIRDIVHCAAWPGVVSTVQGSINALSTTISPAYIHHQLTLSEVHYGMSGMITIDTCEIVSTELNYVAPISTMFSVTIGKSARR